jgi:hypothetical protein
VSTAILGVRPSVGKPLQCSARRRRRPLRVPGAPRRAYFIETDQDGQVWLYAPRRSAPDERGRSHLLRGPEPSWAIAEAALPMAANAGAVGIRVEDASTGLVYTVSLPEFLVRAEPVCHAGFGRQRRLPLRYWAVRPGAGAAPPPARQGHQLPLFPPVAAS